MIWGIFSANCTSVFRWHFFFFKTPEQGWRKAASDTSVKSTHSPSQKFLKGQKVGIYADCPIQTLLGLPAVWLGTKAKPAPQQQRLCPSRELHLNARLILASDRSNMALTPPPSTFHLLWYLKGSGVWLLFRRFRFSHEWYGPLKMCQVASFIYWTNTYEHLLCRCLWEWVA